MKSFRDVDAGQVTLGDLVQTSRSKIIPVSVDGAPMRFVLGTAAAPVTAPFHPSTFGDGSGQRANLLITLPPQGTAWVSAVESRVMEQLRATPEKWDAPAPDALIHQWRTSVKVLRGGSTVLRTKINLPGRAWNDKGNAVPLPENMANLPFQAVVTCKHAWVSSAGVGLVFEVSDLLFKDGADAGVVSPWAD